MSQPWVAIQRNPTSGAGRWNQPIRDLIKHLSQRGIKPRLYSRRADLDEAVRDPARRDSLVAVVAAGGDGTVLDLVNRHPNLPICVLPLGTENLLAKAIKVPRCGQTVAEIIARGNRRRIDLASLNSRHFLIMASFGIDAEVIHQVHQNRGGGHIRHTSYIGPILNAFRTYQPQTLRIMVDDSPMVYEGQLAVIANLSSYALNLGMVPTADGTDGLLDARIFQINSPADLLFQFLSVLRGTHETSSSVTRLQGRKFRIESDTPIPVQVDGDAAGVTPAEITVEPLALEFFVP